MINLEFSLKNNKLPGMVESPRKEDRDSSTPSTLDRPVSKEMLNESAVLTFGPLKLVIISEISLIMSIVLDSCSRQF